MPQRIVALAQNLRRWLQMPSGGGPEPYERGVAGRGVGKGNPFVHGGGGEGPREGGTEGEGMDYWDWFVGVWVFGENGGEGGVVG